MKGHQLIKKTKEPKHEERRTSETRKSFASFMIALERIARTRRDTSVGDVYTRADKMEAIALEALGKTAPSEPGA